MQSRATRGRAFLFLPNLTKKAIDMVENRLPGI